ncbi:MAG: hypothetical protein MUC88_20180 [Planctomycetes bacterium]|nr:hypothetical protein [Planctomycetota bacterium]
MRGLAMVAFLLRTTIAGAFGPDDATRLEASRCRLDESQVEPSRFLRSRAALGGGQVGGD